MMEKLNPEKAVEMLRERGVDISMAQAAALLELLRKFAHIVISQHLENKEPELRGEKFKTD
jgi:hypothetical protein